jgi:uncharacterized protein YkwD
MKATRISRHALAAAGLLGLAVVLSACQSTQSVGDGSGASKTAVAYLAEIRALDGLPPLVSDPQLERAALQQAGYMAKAGEMEHTAGWRKDFATRMAENDIAGPAAENIAHGRMDLEELFTRWKNSPPHRKNMLDKRMNRFGLAWVKEGKGDGRYWALVLAK